MFSLLTYLHLNILVEAYKQVYAIVIENVLGIIFTITNKCGNIILIYSYIQVCMYALKLMQICHQ